MSIFTQVANMLVLTKSYRIDTRLWLLFFFAIVYCFNASCNTGSKTRIPSYYAQPTSSSQELAVVPSDWPYPWLVPPLGATKAVLPFTIRKMASSKPDEYNIARGKVNTDGYFWMMSFSWSGSFEELVKYMENTLIENDFVRREYKAPSRMGNSSLIGFVEFRSKGTSEYVSIQHEKSEINILYDAYEIFYFDVTIYK